MDMQLISVEALLLSYYVFIGGAGSSFQQVIQRSCNTLEAVDGIHIIL